MNRLFRALSRGILHLRILHAAFLTRRSVKGRSVPKFPLYEENSKELTRLLLALQVEDQLYSARERRMILADLYEYLFLGRGYYSILKNKRAGRELFIKAILRFANLLMCYEDMTASQPIRAAVIQRLANAIRSLQKEAGFADLAAWSGVVGISGAANKPPKAVSRYFDSLLPKTAGGLWHELLVYVFLLRNNCGYVVPLLLSQRILSLTDHLVPPDFLVLTADRRLFGIEVGMKKEIQSGGFSLRTAIPTATIDTINSRSSDRCPACNRWILICPHVIANYGDLTKNISKIEVRCREECSIYSAQQVDRGECPYTKFRRSRPLSRKSHTQHPYCDNRHYHYQCVLAGVGTGKRKEIIDSQDSVALKTHYPYYSGLETLMTDVPLARDLSEAAESAEADSEQTNSGRS